MRGVLHIMPLDIAEHPDVQPFMERAKADVVAEAERITHRHGQFFDWLNERGLS